MSVSLVASLRPATHRCLRQSSVGILTIHIASRQTSLHIRTPVSFAPLQTRLRSTANPDQAKRPAKESKGNPTYPKIPFRQLLGQALRNALRNFAVILSPRGFRAAWRASPWLNSAILIMTLFILGSSVVFLRDFYRTFYTTEISRYPDPVANTLRRALLHSHYKPNPELALKLWQKALRQCFEIGLDPLSDEVLGIRLHIALWLEQINNYKPAVEVLEGVLKECRTWVDTMEGHVKNGDVDESGRLGKGSASIPASVQSKNDTAAMSGEKSDTEEETLWQRRQRLLTKAVGTSLKLGELYADEHVLEWDRSQEHLLWAVETSLKEFARRQKEGKKPGETAWMTPEELGSSMEQLGLGYERKSESHLAIPLFFQALKLCQSPCHRATIMNNLSAAFAQHPIYSPNEAADVSAVFKGVLDSSAPKSRSECLEAASNWASNAYTHAQDVRGADRTAECDEACAVALCNWGDVEAMLGKKEVARKKYEQCIQMSTKMEFAQGIKQAQEGLAALSKA